MRVIVDRLSKTYRDRSGHEVAALADLALKVEPEKFVAVLGPSGCDIERQMQWWTTNGFMKRTIPLRGIVDTSFVEEAARAVPEK